MNLWLFPKQLIKYFLAVLPLQLAAVRAMINTLLGSESWKTTGEVIRERNDQGGHSPNPHTSHGFLNRFFTLLSRTIAGLFVYLLKS